MLTSTPTPPPPRASSCSAPPARSPVRWATSVRVTGASTEFFGMSQLTGIHGRQRHRAQLGQPAAHAGDGPTARCPASRAATWRSATAAINAYFEPFEGMLVTFPDTLSVSEYFELARYGQVILSEGGRPRHVHGGRTTPTAAGLIDHEIDLATPHDHPRRHRQPPEPSGRTCRTPPTTTRFRVCSTDNFFRGGDTITNLTGVLHWSFAGQTGTDAWRIRPVTEAFDYAFTPSTPVRHVPSVAGSAEGRQLQRPQLLPLDRHDLVATTSVRAAPSGNLDCRGADSASELERQRAKLLAALSTLDADVFGLIEMENTTRCHDPLGRHRRRPARLRLHRHRRDRHRRHPGRDHLQDRHVKPVGDYAILDSSVDPRFIDTRNRPALAQTFGRWPPVPGLPSWSTTSRARARAAARAMTTPPPARATATAPAPGRRGPGRLAGHRPDRQPVIRMS